MGSQSETKPLRERAWDVSVEVIGPIIYGALVLMIANALTTIKWVIITVLAVALLSIFAFYFLNRRLPKKGIIAIMVLPLLLIGVLIFFPITKTSVPVPETQSVTINQSSTGPNSPNVAGENIHVEIIAKPKPRRLEGEARQKLINTIAPLALSVDNEYAGKQKSRIIIAWLTNGESTRYAEDFVAAFSEAGWEVEREMIGLMSREVLGVRFGIRDKNNVVKTTNELFRILREQNLVNEIVEIEGSMPVQIPKLFVAQNPD